MSDDRNIEYLEDQRPLLEVSSCSDEESDSHLEPSGNGTVLSGIVNLVANSVGAAVLTLPRALQGTGFGFGVVLLLLSIYLSIDAAFILTDCCDRAHAYTYLGIIRKPFGKAAGVAIEAVIAVHVLLVLFLYIVNTGNLIPALLASLVGHKAGDDWWNTEAFTVAVVATVAIAPFTFLRRIDSLKYTSMVSMVFSALTTGGIAVSFFAELGAVGEAGLTERYGPIVNTPTSVLDCFAMLGAMATAVSFHYNACSCMGQLKVRTKKTMHKILVPVGVIILCLYGVISVCGYLNFRGTLANPTNILLHYSDTNYYMRAMQFLMALVSVASYTLVCYGFRRSVLSMAGFSDVTMAPRWLFYVLGLATLVVGYVIALFVEDLGAIAGLAGASTSLIIINICPALCWFKLCPEVARKPLGYIRIAVHLTFGIAVTIIGTIGAIGEMFA